MEAELTQEAAETSHLPLLKWMIDYQEENAQILNHFIFEIEADTAGMQIRLLTYLRVSYTVHTPHMCVKIRQILFLPQNLLITDVAIGVM